MSEAEFAELKEELERAKEQNERNELCKSKLVSVMAKLSTLSKPTSSSTTPEDVPDENNLIHLSNSALEFRMEPAPPLLLILTASPTWRESADL